MAFLHSRKADALSLKLFFIFFSVILSACTTSEEDDDPLDKFDINGRIYDLIGRVTIQNNNADSIKLENTSSFSYRNINDKSRYNISILNQPVGQFCAVNNAVGAINGADINNVNIVCVNNLYSVGGNITGLQGSITLQNNGNESLTKTNSGAFTFLTKIALGEPYLVSVQSQPVGQICSIDNASGSIGGANISDINITCETSRNRTVGGTVSGLTGSLLIKNNDAVPQSVSSNGSYAFNSKLGSGELYNVSIDQNPVGQICSVSNNSGQIGQADIDNVDIFCSAENTTVNLSGSFTVAPFNQLDNDVNRPSTAPNLDNNSFANAQEVSNFSTVQGFATKTGTGRIAEGDRFASTADVSDFYRVVLVKDQTIRLQVVDFEGFSTGGVFEGDLDLYLYNANFGLVASSLSVEEFESIRVPGDDFYYIQVLAYSGTSKYTLAFDPVSPLATGANNSMDFTIGEAIVKFNENTSFQALKTNPQLLRLTHENSNRPTLARFDIADAIAQPLSITKLGTSQTFEQELAQNQPESYQKFKTLQQIKRLNLRQDVEFAEPNYIYHAQKVPNDNLYNLQWHYPAINLPQAWDITTGAGSTNDVIVAVVDTGVFLDHYEFDGQLVAGYDFISNATSANDDESNGGGSDIDNNPDDPGDGTQIGSSSWHGTHVAGTIAAKSNNSIGVAGVAWHAKIMPLRVLGALSGTSYDTNQAIRFAAGLSNDSGIVPAQKADIINLSLGGSGFSQSAQNTYNAVRAEGVIVIAAAGNNNNNQLFYPASYDGVVSVSATDFNHNRAPYSNFGARVDVAAPGGNKLADANNDGYSDGVFSTFVVVVANDTRLADFKSYQGTSMAAPHMAGVVALMRAVHPELTPDELDNFLLSGTITTDLGDTGRDDIYGHGLIDAFKAVQQAQTLANGGTPPPLPAIIISTPNQLTMGLDETADISLSNIGDEPASIISFSDNASWLTVNSASVDTDGLGQYQMTVNRTGLNSGAYTATVNFTLSTGNSLNLPISILVGSLDSASKVGKVFILLRDSENNLVQQINPTSAGNGVFNYRFSDVSLGSYRIIAGTDIDNDLFICQQSEACGAYPTLDAQSDIQVINVDISELDFVVDILSNFGTSGLIVTNQSPAIKASKTGTDNTDIQLEATD